MKKYLSILAALILFFGSKSFAAASNPASDSLGVVIYDFFNHTIPDNRLDTICDRWEYRGGDYCLFLYLEDADYASILISDNFSLTTQNGNVDGFPIFTRGTFNHWDSFNYTYSNDNLAQNYNQSRSITIPNVVYLGTYDSFLIDYTVWSLDYQLPTPDISIYYDTWDLAGGGYYAPFTFYLNNGFSDSENIYLQALVKYYQPDNLLIDQKGNFDVISRENSNYVELISMSENIKSNAFTGALNDLDENWRDFADTVTATYSGVNPSFEQSSTFDYLVDEYESGSKILGMYGSVFEIWVRYWYVDDNYNVKVSKWWSWNNTINDNFTLDIPLSFSSGNPASGIITHNMEPSSPSGNNIHYLGTPTGNSNGTGININVNPNSVPNTYQYPTVTSFNHDNLLVTWINTAQELPSLFSGYALFLRDAFVFIPVPLLIPVGVPK